MRFILSAILAIGFVALAIGQPPPSAKPTGGKDKVSSWPSVKTLPANPPFVSLVGRFSIALSQNIQGFATLTPKQLHANASGQQFTWKFSSAEVTAIYLDFPDSSLTGSTADLDRFIANSKKIVTDEQPNAKLLSEVTSVVDGIPSSYFIYDLGTKGFESVQLFLDKKRIYRFDATFKERSTEDILKTVFKSFKLITQAEVDAELQRKYDAMKPIALPQFPVVAKAKSDAEDEGFKGRVKKVVEDSEDRSGTWSAQGRKLSSVVYYDKNGALTQRDAYDSQGNPFQITVYGYINDKRVSNSNMTRYEYDPPPAAAPPGTSSTKTIKKNDPRYEYSFEYRYVNGKLAEFQMFGNDGRKGMRYVYKHSPNKIEELVYTEDGELNQRYLSTLDSTGNVTEMVDFGLDNYELYGDRKYRYSYEFDDEGNWIKRTTEMEITQNGVAEFQPYSFDYRTITYY